MSTAKRLRANLTSTAGRLGAHAWGTAAQKMPAVGVALALLLSVACFQIFPVEQGQQLAVVALAASAPIPIPNQRPPLAFNRTSAGQRLTTPVPVALSAISASPAVSSANQSSLSYSALTENRSIDATLDATGENLVTSSATSLVTIAATDEISTVIGYSTGSLPIVVYHFGAGPRRVAFVGGIHGGSEWNSVLLAYAAIDHFTAHPNQVPAALTLQIIPVANPDGLLRVTGKVGRFSADDARVEKAVGRFNQRGVDLNRNWDCAWEATAWWGSQEINAGTAPFSEVETRVLRNFFLAQPNIAQPKVAQSKVAAVVFWHSVVPGVFAGGCSEIYAAAEQLAESYATAAGYPYGEAFTHYPITGDATNWLSKQEIPAIVVELASATDPEWPRNLAGIQAVLDLLD